jgi:heme exporter protein D
MAIAALDGTGGYVAAAYAIFLALVVVYVAVIASKLRCTRRLLADRLDRRRHEDDE